MMGGSIKPPPPIPGGRVQATNSVGAWIDSAPPDYPTPTPRPEDYYFYDSTTQRLTALVDLVRNPPMIVKDDESRN